MLCAHCARLLREVLQSETGKPTSIMSIREYKRALSISRAAQTA